MSGKDIKDNYREIRKGFIQKSLDNFSSVINDENDKEFKIQIVDNASSNINIRYWHIVDNNVRLMLYKDASHLQDTKIDIFKILSCCEYAVMAVMPIRLYSKDNVTPLRISDDSNKSDEFENFVKTRYFNAKFAYFYAKNLMINWEWVDRNSFNRDIIINNIEVVENFNEYNIIPDYTDGAKLLEERSPILEEHINTLAFTKIESFPVFTNANWWRLFAYCTYLTSKKDKA